MPLLWEQIKQPFRSHFFILVGLLFGVLAWKCRRYVCIKYIYIFFNLLKCGFFQDYEKIK